MSRRQTPSLTLLRIFAAPACVAIASAIGLVMALLGDGAYDVASWLTLSIPVAAIGWAILKRRI